MNFRTEPEIIYEDDELRILHQSGNSDFILVTFGDLITLADGRRFFADRPVTKLRLNAIGFMAKRQNWYPKASLAAAAPAVQARLAPFTQRIAYGGSMGGYAALKYSHLLGITTVIAHCPQWSIDPAECGGDYGWRDYFAPALAGMGITKNDIAGNVLVFSDPFDKNDRFHAEQILRAAPAARLVPVPFVEHHVTLIFAGTDHLQQLLDAALSQDRRALHLQSRRTRRAHAIYQQNILRRAKTRRPAAVLRAIQAQPQCPGWADASLLLSLAASFFIRRDTARLRASLAMLRSLNPILADLMAAAHLSTPSKGQPQALILSAHGQALVYDSAARSCTQAIQANPFFNVTLLPVTLSLSGEQARLRVRSGGGTFELSLDPAGRLIPCFTAEGALFQITPLADGKFTLRHAGKYLCAAVDGHVICNRDAALAWEEFSLGYAAG